MTARGRQTPQSWEMWVLQQSWAWTPHLAPQLHLLAQELHQGLVAVGGKHRLVPELHLQLQRAQAAPAPAGTRGGRWMGGWMMDGYFTKQEVAQHPSLPLQSDDASQKNSRPS